MKCWKIAQYATLLSELRRSDEAEGYHNRAVAVDESNVNVLGNFANFLKKEKRPEEAKVMYCKGLSLHGDDSLIRRNYALFLRDFPKMRTGVSKR